MTQDSLDIINNLNLWRHFQNLADEAKETGLAEAASDFTDEARKHWMWLMARMGVDILN